MPEAVDPDLSKIGVMLVDGLKPLGWLAKTEIIAIQRVEEVWAEITMILF